MTKQSEKTKNSSKDTQDALKAIGDVLGVEFSSLQHALEHIHNITKEPTKERAN